MCVCLCVCIYKFSHLQSVDKIPILYGGLNKLTLKSL